MVDSAVVYRALRSNETGHAAVDPSGSGEPVDTNSGKTLGPCPENSEHIGPQSHRYAKHSPTIGRGSDYAFVSVVLSATRLAEGFLMNASMA